MSSNISNVSNTVNCISLMSGSDCMPDEKKVYYEEPTIEESLAQKTNNCSRKKFKTTRDNVHVQAVQAPRNDFSNTANFPVVKVNTSRNGLNDYKSTKQRRRYSDNAGSFQLEDANIFDSPLNTGKGDSNLNDPVGSLHIASKIDSEPTMKSSRRRSELNDSHVNSQSIKKIAPIMRHSKSEDAVGQSSKDEIKIARKYIESVGMVIKNIDEKQALIFDRKLDRFVIKKIHKTNSDELENCIRKISEKIELIAKYEFSDMRFEEDVQLFEEIISHLEKAKWSSSLFNKSSNNLLGFKLDLAKKAVESVKTQNILREELSTELVSLLLGEKLEAAELRMTLNDLSLVFPKIMTLPNLLSKVLQALIHLTLRNNPLSSPKEPKTAKNQKFESRITLLLEFCIKCFENQVGLSGYLNEDNACLLKKICEFAATPEMKIKLNNAFENTFKYANAQQNFSATPEMKIKLNAFEGASKSANAKHEMGFYHFFKEGQSKDRKQIVSQIARSIVKKTASKFVKVPLDELLSGKIDDKLVCPIYNQMAVTINNLSYIVVSDILSYEDITDRREVISFYVEVIKECIALGDFASSYSLKMGFDFSSISRLTDTWDKKTSNLINKYNELFEHKGFYKNLFNETKNNQSDYFIMPSMIFASKLNFIEENLSKKVIRQSQLRRLAREVIIPIQNIKKNLNLSGIKALITHEVFDKRLEELQTSLPNDDTLFKLSEKIQPRK